MVASDPPSGGTIVQRIWRVVAVAALAIVVTGLVPTDRAWACSCSEPTVEEIVGREPGAAVVRVRRIDPDGGTSGVAEVREVLHGPEMPAQLPLALDDGASCLPWLAVGDVAVLTFVPDPDGWRTLECGRLDPRVGLDPLAVDTEASGPVAVVVAGRLPGADLLALDAQLRVLAVRNVGDVSHEMEPCADDLLVPTRGPEGQLSILLLDLPGFEVVDRRELSTGELSEMELLSVSCDGERVDVVTRSWTETQELWLHEDVFLAERRVRLPSAEDAALVGDDVLLLRTGASRAATEVVRRGRGGNDEERVATLPGVMGHELLVAPDGRHAAVRGSGQQEPVLAVVDLAAGREVARSPGWWQPVRRPWIGPDRLLLLDEDSGGIGDSTGLADHRIVDLRLDTVAELEPSPAWTTASGHDHVVQVDGDSLVVRDAAGERVRTTAAPWAAGVYDALALGRIEADAGEAPEAELPSVDPAVGRMAERAGWSASMAGAVTGMLSTPVGLALAGLATVGLLAALAVRRWTMRHRDPPPTDRLGSVREP